MTFRVYLRDILGFTFLLNAVPFTSQDPQLRSKAVSVARVAPGFASATATPRTVWLTATGTFSPPRHKPAVFQLLLISPPFCPLREGQADLRPTWEQLLALPH